MDNRILRAAVLGTAVGDALGVPVEFKSRDELEQDPVTGMRAYGTHHQPAGSWSDDTSMLLATLDSLIHGYDPEDIMARFDRWLNGGAYTPRGEVFDRGLIVAQAVRQYRMGRKALLCGGSGEQDNGNGSLMRVMPACLYAAQRQAQGRMTEAESVRLIHEVSALTHAHVVSKAGCGLYYFMVKALLGDCDGSLTSALQRGVDACLAWYRANDWYNYGDALERYGRLFDLKACRMTPEDRISSKGYVVATLEAAVWCLLNTESLKDALLRAVNLGSDTDTVAAVAGGLAGLYYGMEAIPADWLEALLRREWIEQLCDDAAETWNR